VASPPRPDVLREPATRDPRIWLWRVLTALDTLHARLAADSAADPAGWALGGLATVRTLVERARQSVATHDDG
jgi:hypothetical protein